MKGNWYIFISRETRRVAVRDKKYVREQRCLGLVKELVTIERETM
jgi:hypothetical protein